MTEEMYNNYPVYRKEEGGQVIFVDDRGEWVIFCEVGSKRSLRNRKEQNRDVPPFLGWQYWDNDAQKWNEDEELWVLPLEKLKITSRVGE